MFIVLLLATFCAVLFVLARGPTLAHQIHKVLLCSVSSQTTLHMVFFLQGFSCTHSFLCMWCVLQLVLKGIPVSLDLLSWHVLVLLTFDSSFLLLCSALVNTLQWFVFGDLCLCTMFLQSDLEIPFLNPLLWLPSSFPVSLGKLSIVSPLTWFHFFPLGNRPGYPHPSEVTHKLQTNLAQIQEQNCHHHHLAQVKQSRLSNHNTSNCKVTTCIGSLPCIGCQAYFSGQSRALISCS
jgi:hypothetical protein